VLNTLKNLTCRRDKRCDLLMGGLTASGSYTPSGGGRKVAKKVAIAARDNARTIAWAALLMGATAATGFVLAREGGALPAWWLVAAVGITAGLAERHGVPLLGDRQKGIESAVSFVPYVFAAVAFGPLAALLVGFIGGATDFRRPYLRWLVYTPARALAAGVAGVAAAKIAGAGEEFGATVVAATAAALAYFAADAAFNMGTLAVRGSASPLTFPRALAPLVALAITLYVPIVAFLVYGYHQYSFIVVATFLIPLLALQRVVHLYQEQRAAARELASVNEMLERANLSFATALVATLDARDRYTAGHSAAVAVYSRDIARQLALSDAEQALAYRCGLVHDIGKIGLPAALLEKVGPLTLEERRLMQQHSVIGERILAMVDDYEEIARIVRHHHERVDGNGYPDGLTKGETPLLSRIISVADAYNAMTSDRPYRDAMPSRVARLRLAQAVETQFDIAVVAAFEAVLASASEEYRLATSDDFAFAASSRGPSADESLTNVA